MDNDRIYAQKNCKIMSNADHMGHQRLCLCRFMQQAAHF